MFAIGNALRGARLRQGLTFPELETATRISTRCLRALEEERFDQLPAQSYARSFLRTYADSLGLDGQLYVDEFNSRYGVGEDGLPARRTELEARLAILRDRVTTNGRKPRSEPRLLGRRNRRINSRLLALVIAVLGIAAVTALSIGFYEATRSSNQAASAGAAAPAGARDTQVTPQPTQADKQTSKQPPVHKKKKPKPVRKLVLTAKNGASWIDARVRSSIGRQLYVGTLQPGDKLTLPTAKTLWLRVGAPASLSWKLNGKVQPLPGKDVGNFIVTPRRIRPAL